MKKTIYAVLILVAASLSYAAESRYKDRPTGIDATLEKFLSQYIEQARDGLPYFNKKFESQDDKSFYVITRIYEGEIYEQIFVRLKEIRKGSYEGEIASDPMGQVKFNSGDAIEVKVEDVVDWLIVNEDDTEEGNLQGKAADLIQVGYAVFFVALVPVDGKYSSFDIVSVQNPQTQQEVIEIVPQQILDDIEKKVAATHAGKPAESDEASYTYHVVSFPGWEIVDDSKN